jgi:hypothetical protein
MATEPAMSPVFVRANGEKLHIGTLYLWPGDAQIEAVKLSLHDIGTLERLVAALKLERGTC